MLRLLKELKIKEERVQEEQKEIMRQNMPDKVEHQGNITIL